MIYIKDKKEECTHVLECDFFILYKGKYIYITFSFAINTFTVFSYFYIE